MDSNKPEGINKSGFRFSFGRKDGKYATPMVSTYQKQLFGDFDTESKINDSLYTVCLEDYSGNPVCFLCLNTYPWTLSVPPWDWEFWINKLYGVTMVNSWNCLWIHLILWDQKYKTTFFRPLLQGFFARKSVIKYLLLILPPNIKSMNWIDSHGIRIFPKDVETRNCQTLVLFTSDEILPRYKIRQAVEEDNDDVVEIIQKDSARLTEIYGEYYIAEILKTHRNSGRQIIVAEYEGVAVAVAILNENVNLDLLKDNFELTPLFNLRKFPDEEVDYLFDISEPFPCYEMDDEGEESKEELESPKTRTRVKSSIFKMHSENTSESELSSIPSEEVLIRDVLSLHTGVSYADGLESESTHSNLTGYAKSKTLDKYAEYYTPHLYDEQPNTLKPISNTKVLTSKDHKISRTRLDTYIGDSNAFVIEIASALEEHSQTALPKLFAISYECFPDRDFAILAMNPQCFAPSFLEIFTRLTPRPCHSFDDVVYFQHRDFFYAKPYVREASMKDFNTISKSTRSMLKKEKFLEDFTQAVCDSDCELSAYVLCTKSKIIGAAIIQPLNDIEQIKELYWLKGCYSEKIHKPYTFGMINNAFRSSVFSRYTIFFLTQLHRIADFSMIFHEMCYSDTEDNKRVRFMNNLLEIMVPIKVKIQPEEINASMTAEDRKFLDRKEPLPPEKPTKVVLLSIPQRIARPSQDVNHKIVIAGSGPTAIAFLEGLLCTWSEECRLNYTNITVVAPKPIDIDRDFDPSFLMFTRSISFTEKWINCIMIRSKINYVSGEISAIDRKNKVVVVDDCAFLKYDVLMLICGGQFQKPGFNPRNALQQPSEDNFPLNVFIINSQQDGQHALSKLQTLIEEAKSDTYNSIIVYGNFLEAYCCLNALLATGIPGKNLVFVDPPFNRDESILETPMNKNIFDSNVLDAVRSSIISNGIRMHTDYNFDNWDYDPKTKCVTGARFKTKRLRIYEPCIAMFMYVCRTVSLRSFMAMNKSGLVFDGGLVIDNQYRTNDPYIYAAGAMTKYSRKYYADHLSHRYYNLDEVGHDLGKKINTAFMSAVKKQIFIEEKIPLVCEDGDYIVRSFKEPIKMFCILPRDLQYLCVTKPGKFIPSATPQDSNEYGRDLVTGDINDLSKQGFFKIHLNKHNHIETVMCLSRFKLDKNNLFSIWGKHESLFNKMLLRYEMGLIKDFFEYFRQPWTYVLYLNDFDDELHKIKEKLFSYSDSTLGKPLSQYIIDIYRWNNWKKLDKDVKGEIDEKFRQTDYPELIKEQVIQYINKSANSLPMYMLPVNDTHLFFDDNEESPLFKPQ